MRTYVHTEHYDEGNVEVFRLCVMENKGPREILVRSSIGSDTKRYTSVMGYSIEDIIVRSKVLYTTVDPVGKNGNKQEHFIKHLIWLGYKGYFNFWEEET